jgi:hypothetical protein
MEVAGRLRFRPSRRSKRKKFGMQEWQVSSEWRVVSGVYGATIALNLLNH